MGGLEHCEESVTYRSGCGSCSSGPRRQRSTTMYPGPQRMSPSIGACLSRGNGTYPFPGIDNDLVTLLSDSTPEIGGIRGSDYATATLSARAIGPPRASYRRYVPPNSVMAKLLRISPFKRGVKYFFCCSALAYRAKTSATTGKGASDRLLFPFRDREG